MKSKFRVEHYRVEAFTEPLKIIQDQRQEARKFVVLTPLLMVIAYAFGPLGGMRINGEHLDWFFFSAVEFGLMVSMGVVIYATGYTKEHLFTATSLRVIVRRKGKIVSDEQHRISQPLKAELLYHPTLPGNTPPPAFNWTLVLAFSDDKTVQLVSSTRKTMDALIQVLRTRFKLQITERTEWTSGTKALARAMAEVKKQCDRKND